MKILATIAFALSPCLAFAEPTDYEASIEIQVDDVSALLSSLNERLELKLDDEALAGYAESISVGHSYSLDFDMYYGGAVFNATYQVAKAEAGRVELSFTSFQKRATRAICLEMAEFSKTSGAEYSPKSCDYDRPEEFEI